MLKLGTSLLITLIVLIWSGCSKPGNKIDIRGSWYSDFQRTGLDSSLNYFELHFGDSSFYAQDEVMGHGRDRLYMVAKDSIYYGDDSTDLAPFYRIIALKNDTLWLKANPEILKNLDTVYYVRFPKSEYGHYDLVWTNENRDSLMEKVDVDYNRRMWKHWAIKFGNMEVYDSMERAGFWKWSMKEVREAEEKEKGHLN